MQNKPIIAVLRGGSANEREISLRSGAAVVEGLQQAGYEVLDGLLMA